MRKNVAKIVILGLLDVLSAVCLFFPNWVSVEYKGYFTSEKWTFTLWKMLENMNKGHDGISKMLVIIAYILLVLSILFMIYTGYTLYQNYISGASINTVGPVLSGVFSIYIILLLAMFEEDALSCLTFVPYLVAMIAAAAFVINLNMPDKIPGNGENSLRRPGAAPVFTPPAPSRSCPVCGAASADAKATFCGVCGAKMDTKRLCRSCGAELKPNMRFCSNCGASAQLDQPNPDRKFDQKDN